MIARCAIQGLNCRHFIDDASSIVGRESAQSLSYGTGILDAAWTLPQRTVAPEPA